MHLIRKSLVGIAVLGLIAAGCNSDDSDTVSAGSGPVASDEQADYEVAGFYEAVGEEFKNLEDLVDRSEIVALFEVTGERDGRDTSTDVPDARTVQRILDLKVVDPIKGVKEGQSVPLWHGTWTLKPTGKDGWDRQALAVTTEDYELKVGQQVVLALVPDPGEPAVYVVQSDSGFFVADSDDPQSFEEIPRENKVAASEQRRSVDEVIDEMKAAASS